MLSERQRENAGLTVQLKQGELVAEDPEDQWLAVQKTIGWLLEYGSSLSMRPWAVAWSDANISVECAHEYKATLVRLESLAHQWLSRQTAHAHAAHSQVVVAPGKPASSQSKGASADSSKEGESSAGSGHFQLHEAVAALQMLWAMDRRLRLERKSTKDEEGGGSDDENDNGDMVDAAMAVAGGSGAEVNSGAEVKPARFQHARPTASNVPNQLLLTLLNTLAQAAKVGVDILPVWTDLVHRCVQRLGPERVCGKLYEEFEALAAYEELTVEKEEDDRRDHMEMSMSMGKGGSKRGNTRKHRKGKTDSFPYVSVRLGLQSLVHAAFHTFCALPIHSTPLVEDEDEVVVVDEKTADANLSIPIQKEADMKGKASAKEAGETGGGRASPGLARILNHDAPAESRAYYAHALLLGGLARILPSAARVMGTDWVENFVGPFRAVLQWLLADALSPPRARDGYCSPNRDPGSVTPTSSKASPQGKKVPKHGALAIAGADDGGNNGLVSDSGTGCFYVRFPAGTSTLHLQDKKGDNVTAGNWEALSRLAVYLKTVNVPHEIFIELVLRGNDKPASPTGDEADIEYQTFSSRHETTYDVGEMLRTQARQLELREGRELSEEEVQRAGSYLKNASYCPLVEELALWRADAVRDHLLEQCGVDPTMISIDYTLDRMCSRKEPPTRSVLTNPFTLPPGEGSLYEMMVNGAKKTRPGSADPPRQAAQEDAGSGVAAGTDEAEAGAETDHAAGDLVLCLRLDPSYVIERGCIVDERPADSDDDYNEGDEEDEEEELQEEEEEEDPDEREADDTYDDGFGKFAGAHDSSEEKDKKIQWAPLFGFMRPHGQDHAHKKDVHFAKTSPFAQHGIHVHGKNTLAGIVSRANGKDEGASSSSSGGSHWGRLASNCKAASASVVEHGICQRPELAHPSFVHMVLDASDVVDQAKEVATQEAQEATRLEELAKQAARAKADERLARAKVTGDLFDLDMLSEPPTPKPRPDPGANSASNSASNGAGADGSAAGQPQFSESKRRKREARRVSVRHQQRAGVLGGGKIVFSFHWSDRRAARLLHDGIRRRGFDCLLPAPTQDSMPEGQQTGEGAETVASKDADETHGDRGKDDEAARAEDGTTAGGTGGRRWGKAKVHAPWIHSSGSDGLDQPPQVQRARSHVSAGCSFEQMSGASVVVVFISTAYLMQWSCGRELNFALSTGLPIVPVLVQDPFETLRWNYTPELKSGLIGALLVGRCREATVNLAGVLPDPRSGRLLPSCKQLREVLSILAKRLNAA
jgi:hypothetical protein